MRKLTTANGQPGNVNFSNRNSGSESAFRCGRLPRPFSVSSCSCRSPPSSNTTAWAGVLWMLCSVRLSISGSPTFLGRGVRARCSGICGRPQQSCCKRPVTSGQPWKRVDTYVTVSLYETPCNPIRQGCFTAGLVTSKFAQRSKSRIGRVAEDTVVYCYLAEECLRVYLPGPELPSQSSVQV